MLACHVGVCLLPLGCQLSHGHDPFFLVVCEPRGAVVTSGSHMLVLVCGGLSIKGTHAQLVLADVRAWRTRWKSAITDEVCQRKLNAHQEESSVARETTIGGVVAGSSKVGTLAQFFHNVVV